MGRLCECGCGKEIITKPSHRYFIPKYLLGHNNRGKSVFPNGRKFTKEHIKNLSLSLLGRPSWNKGTKGICKANSGSFKKGQIPWNKGKKGCFSITKEIIAKRVESRKGYKHSKATKEKLYLARLKRKEMLGYINSPITRKKMSETHKKLFSSGKGIYWNKGLTKETDERVLYLSKIVKESRKTQILPKKDTKIEVKIQDYLKQLQVDFFTHQYMKINHSYQCDIFIPAMELIIECDGDYWHKYPIGRDIDNIRTKELIEKGFKVLRLWEREIKVMDINDFEEKVVRCF